MCAARAVRLQRVRETSISPTALLEQRLRRPYELEPLDESVVPKRRPETSVEDELEETTEPKEAAAGSTRGTKKRGWKEKYVFGCIERNLADVGSMEKLLLRNKEGLPGDYELARSILHPGAAAYMKHMSPQLCAELQRRVFEKLRKVISTERRACEKLKMQLDRRGIFDSDINAQRVHTLFLANVHKELRVRHVEDECLAELVAEMDKKSGKYDRKKARSILFGIKTSAAIALETKKLKDEKQPMTRQSFTKSLSLAGLTKRETVTDEMAFESFKAWYDARERRDKHHGAHFGLRPLPATPMLAESFNQYGTVRRLVKVDLGHNGFENTFRRSPTPPAEPDEVEEEVPVPSVDVVAREPTPTIESTSSTPTRSRKRSKSRMSLNSAAVGPPILDEQSMQERLAKSWFDLHLTTAQKLAFLQKYASLEDAPLLPKAVKIWEDAAELFAKRTRILVLRERVQGGEAFGATEFVQWIDDAVGRDDAGPVPPDLVEKDTQQPRPSSLPRKSTRVVAPAFVDSERADAWLASLVHQFDADLAHVAKLAMEQLGDRLPDLRVSLATIRTRQ